MTSRAALAGVLLFVGCNGGKATGSCPLPANLTGDNVAQALVLAQLCGSAGCAPIADAVLQQALASPFVAPLSVALANAVDAGTLYVDAPHAMACLGALADGCHARPDQTKPPVECRNVLVPKVPAGGVCFTSLDCVSGYCGGSAAGGCPGQCIAVGDAGCKSPDDCGPWETCTPGGACGPGAAVAAGCAQDSDCAVGLVCVGTSCAMPGKASAICANDSQCASGFFCASTSPAASTGTCTSSLGQGQACAKLGSFLACGFGSYCSDPAFLVGGSGTCAPYGAVGDACLQPPGDDEIPTCQAGLNCDARDAGPELPSRSVCTLPPASGACDQSFGVACSFSDYCDGQQQCQPLKSDGAACDEGPVDGFGCASGQCSPGDAGVCVPAGSICQ